MVSTPKPPDPTATAAAQAQYNQQTAATTQAMNMVDQYTPTGNLVYSQIGNQTVIGADGKPIQVPKYSATQTLSPEQQAIFDKTQATQGNIASAAEDRSAFFKDYLAQPFDVNSEVEQKLYDLGASRLDPRFAREQESMRTQLINSGIRPGTAAYSAAMNDFGQTKNDAYNSLALNGRQQAFQEASYERAMPFNEISSLLSGSQITQPNYVSTPQTGVGGVDYSGLVQNKYNADVQRSNSAMGGLFGLLSGGIGLLSDERAKTDIERVGETNDGTPIYTYRYKDGGPVMMGVMAQEVEKTNPEAVINTPSGMKMVDYGRVG